MNDARVTERDRKRQRAWTWSLALAAFALRAFVALSYDAHHPQARALLLDEAAYDRWARAIAGGDWLGQGVFFQEPLYAYLLGCAYRVFGPDLLLVRLVQAFLGALTCVVVGRIAERVAGVWAGRIAAVALALYGPLLSFPCFVLKETLLVLVLALLTLALLRSRASTRPWRAGLAIGALCGLGALLKGNVLALTPLVAAWPLVRAAAAQRSNAWKQSLATCAAFALVLAPVAWRNHHVAGEWIPTSSQAGTNVYAGNNAENLFGRASETGFVRGVPEHEADDWRREAERRAGRALAAGEVSSFWLRETWRSCVARPALHLAILWNKLRLTLGAYEVPDDHAWAWDRQFVPLLRAPWLGFGVVGTLGLAGAVWILVRRSAARARGIDVGPACEVALLGFLYLGTIVLTVTSDRARLPLVVWLAPCAAGMVVVLARAWRARARGELAALFGLLVAAAVLVHAPVLPASEIAEDFDEREFNEAASLLQRGELDTSRAMVAGLVQRHPRSARTRALAAEIELVGLRARLGDASGSVSAAARAELDRLAEQLDELAAHDELPRRERFRLDRLSGAIELERRRWDVAQERLARAHEFDADDAVVSLGLARAFLAQAESGPRDAARARIERAIELLDALPAARDVESRSAEWILLRAHADFLSGRSELASADADERARAQAAIRAALERLRPLAADGARSTGERRAARLLAGRIQLAIGTPAALESAENHFRAALKLGADAQAQLGLAQALTSRAELDTSAEVRAQRTAEARELARMLAQLDEQNPALRELNERLERLR